MIYLYVIGAVALVVLVFLWWRWTSVERGMRKRDERILRSIDHIGRRIESDKTLSVDDVREVARRPEVRHLLYAALWEMRRPELIPPDFDSQVHQAESALAYWMMHPNELHDAPKEIELVESFQRAIDEQQATFHVFRYRMPDGHWAAKDGWLLGVSGPFFGDGKKPYSYMPGAFSRCDDKYGEVQPAEIVDWCLSVFSYQSHQLSK